MGITLYDYKGPNIKIHIYAYINDEKLKIEGQDLGTIVEESFGDSDYEYFYSLSKMDTQKLQELLKKDTNSNKELLELMQDCFSGSDCCAKFRNYCEKNSIKYEFFSY